MKQSNKGLKKIPEYISANVSSDIIAVLKEDGHGISFPHKSFCQVRIKREEKTYSKCFAYSRYEDIETTIKAAMKHHTELMEHLIDIGVIRRFGKGYGGISFVQRIDRRNGVMEYFHSVWYKNPVTGKTRQRMFYHGKHYPTPGQWLHGHRTALFFKAEQARIANTFGTCINHAKYSGWKQHRYYEEGSPVVDYNSL